MGFYPSELRVVTKRPSVHMSDDRAIPSKRGNPAHNAVVVPRIPPNSTLICLELQLKNCMRRGLVWLVWLGVRSIALGRKAGT